MGARFLEAGKIVNTHGVRGEVKIQPWADSPGFLTGFKRMYIDGEQVDVLSSRVHKGCVIAAFGGVGDIDAAISLKNRIICIDRDDAPLGEGRHFIADIVGLSAIDAATGEMFGKISDVLTLPANDVYVIKGTGKEAREILIPAVPDFVDEMNIAESYVKFRMVEGL